MDNWGHFTLLIGVLTPFMTGFWALLLKLKIPMNEVLTPITAVITKNNLFPIGHSWIFWISWTLDGLGLVVFLCSPVAFLQMISMYRKPSTQQFFLTDLELDEFGCSQTV